MATTTKASPMNVYAKLLTARTMFLAAGAKKSGKNMHMRYQYFELDDIVPIAQPIFQEVGLLPIVNFSESAAVMAIRNIDAPDEVIEFASPMRELTGNAAINPLQALGASQTYLRRYLYMIALDIVEPDFTEATLTKPTEMPEVPTPKPVEVDKKSNTTTVKTETTTEKKEATAPAEKKATPAPAKGKISLSQAERDKVKEELTDANGKPDEQQIIALKGALKAYQAADKSEKQKASTAYISKVAVETTSFKNLTKVRWEELMAEVRELIAKE